MMTLQGQIRSESLSIFDNLDRFSRSEVKLLNCYQQTFVRKSGWQKWLREGFAELLESFQGTRLHICQINEVGPEQKQNYVFEKAELLIGRGDDNDIVLGVSAVSRRHARIFDRAASYFVEDLGSSTGTYLNGRSLKLLEPQPLIDGDELLIFPYRLQARFEDLWVPDSCVEISWATGEGSTGAHFRKNVPSGFSVFGVQIHPGCGDALLAVNDNFLKSIVSGMTREPIDELVAADLGLFEFVLVHVLERANRELKLPLQFALQPSPISIDSSDPGLSFELLLRAAAGVGTFKIFLPDKSVIELRALAGPAKPGPMSAEIKLALPIRVGYLSLALTDLAEVETGDILLYFYAPELILPATAKGEKGIERGWQLTESSKDPYHFRIQKFFERSLLMENENDLETDEALAEKPDLSGLPVRVSVVLSQIELSFRELDALEEGSILELDHVKSDAVQLVANGKFLGTGRLVEVEDQLGVRIAKWGVN